MEFKKKLSLIVCIIIILICSIICVLYREELFMNKVVIKYGDGCKEVYINTNLTTPVCEVGRALEQEEINNNILGNK